MGRPHSVRLNSNSLAVVSALGALVVLLAAQGVADQHQGSVAYPSDYRSWQHVKSMIIQPGHPLEDPFRGIHHIYANSKAMSGLTSGQYEDGAVFVFDLLDYDDSDKTIVEKERMRLDVMERDSERFSRTGDAHDAHRWLHSVAL